MKNQDGSISGLIVATISIVTLIGAFTGLVVNNAQFNQKTEAQINSSGVMLEEGTIEVEKIDDRKIEIKGKICYSTHPRTGGHEDWTLWPTDNRGKTLETRGNSDHIDGGRLTVSPGGSFPAKCEYTNRKTGEGRLIDRNTKQPRRFSIIATTRSKISETNCPTVNLNYRGTWFQGIPFATVDLSTIPGICGPSATPTTPPSTPTPPGATATPEPTATLIPTETPSPTPRADVIKGRVAVYSCEQPSSANVELCTGDFCDEGEGTQLPLVTDPVDHGIWLNDDNDDRTWIYEYSITEDEFGNPLEVGKDYYLAQALGWFDGDTVYYESEREESDLKKLTPGSFRDFEVYANRTCGCSFDAVANLWEYDSSGNLRQFTALDNKPGVAGTANSKQVFEDGDKPASGGIFNNLGTNPGRIDVHLDDLGDFRTDNTWGRDTLTDVKLYAPGYKVVKQICESEAEAPGCPGYETSSEKDASDVRDPNVFSDLRIACNVDVDYGWVVEKLPDPTATPAPVSGNGEVEILTFVWLDKDFEEPPTCDIAKLRRMSSRDGVNRYSDDCEMEIRDLDGNTLYEVEKDNCSGHVFKDIPAGEYTLKVGMPSELTNFCQGERRFTVKPHEVTRVPYVKGLRKSCGYRHATETTCGNAERKEGCKGIGGKCLGRINGTGTQLCCAGDGESGGGDGGGGQGGCSTEAGLLCTGTGHGFGSVDPHPDDKSRDGQAMCRWKDGEVSGDKRVGGWVGWCSDDHDNACCSLIDEGSTGPGPEEPVSPPPGGGDELTCADDWYYDQGKCDPWTDAEGRRIPGCIGDEQCIEFPNEYHSQCCTNAPETDPPNDPSFGYCQISNREFGTLSNRAVPFSSRSEATRNCNDEFGTGGYEVLSSVVEPHARRLGTGFCCKDTSRPEDPPDPEEPQNSCPDSHPVGPFSHREACPQSQRASIRGEKYCCAYDEESNRPARTSEMNCEVPGHPRLANCKSAIDNDDEFCAFRASRWWVCTMDPNAPEPQPDPPAGEEKNYYARYVIDAASNVTTTVWAAMCQRTDPSNCERMGSFTQLFNIPEYKDFTESLDSSKAWFATCRVTSIAIPGKDYECDCKKKTVAAEGTARFEINRSILFGMGGDTDNCREIGSDADANSVTPEVIDIDSNGVINTFDLDLVMNGYGLNTQEIGALSTDGFTEGYPDVNRDGTVNALDLTFVIDSFGTFVIDSFGDSTEQ